MSNQNKNDGSKKIIFGSIAVAIATIYFIGDGSENNSVSSNIIPPPTLEKSNAAESHSAPIDPDVFDRYERRDWPKLYSKWGENGIRRIQKLRESAAASVAKNPKCDAVDISDISESRSTIPDNPVVYVDCRNGERFYIDESDAKHMVNSEKEKGRRFSTSELIKMCTAGVKSKLNIPDSFSQSIFSVSDYLGDSGNRVIQFDFEAKNRLGLTLPAKARCIMTTRGDLEISVIE